MRSLAFSSGKYFCLAAMVLGSSSAFAGRTLIAPAVHWHDWINIPFAFTGAGIDKPYSKSVEITVTNVGSSPQTITVVCIPSGFSYSGNSPDVISFGVNVDGSGVAGGSAYASGTPLQYQITGLTQGQSSTFSFFALYYVAAGAPIVPDAIHLMGTYGCTFNISDDRGAITAVMNTNYENRGITLDIVSARPDLEYFLTSYPFTSGSVSMTAISSMLRNVGRTYQINGGRPF